MRHTQFFIIREYDSQRGSGTQQGDSYFNEESDDIPPSYDPLKEDWEIACTYYSDLIDIETRLSKISWRLAFSFRAYLLEEKLFQARLEVAEKLEQKFLELYFGKNPEIISFAQILIMDGEKLAAKRLNKAVSVLGSNIEPEIIINKIRKDFPIPPKSSSELMGIYGITYDGKQYRFNQYKYKELSDAINYAKSCNNKQKL